MKPLLSILIPTLPIRNGEIGFLLDDLQFQMMAEKIKDEVEILYLGDNKVMTVGKKRNLLKSMASGKFITFIDDDDTLADSYLKEIVKAIQNKPRIDVICYNVLISINGGVKKSVIYSKDFKKDKNLDDTYERIPNHLMVWSKRLADKEDFKNINFGEDAGWAKRMYKHIKTEYKIDTYLYHYRCNHSKSETLPDGLRKILLDKAKLNK